MDELLCTEDTLSRHTRQRRRPGDKVEGTELHKLGKRLDEMALASRSRAQSSNLRSCRIGRPPRGRYERFFTRI